MKVVVVGGGIAGICAALFAKLKGLEVVLIEASPVLGGLLNSVENGVNDSFDMGTHMIAGTEVPEIDCHILPESFTNDLHKFKGEHAGHFFNGKMVDDCTFIHTQGLDNNEYLSCLEDLKKLQAEEVDCQDYSDLQKQLESFFGVGFTQKVLTPSMKKFYGVDDISDLSVNAHLLFGMRRIVVETPEKTRALKKEQFWDDRIAYHSFDEGAYSSVQYYPPSGGAGNWIKFLERRLEDLGVEIFKNTQITSLIINKGRVDSVKLSNDKTVTIKDLFWTAPPVMLLKMANIKTESASKVEIRKTKLINLVFDSPPKVQCRYFICHDPSLLPFRVTLYSNFQKEIALEKGRHKVTVEVLSSSNFSDDELILRIKEDLIAMKVFSNKSNELFSEVLPLKMGFPVLTKDFVSSLEESEKAVDENLQNVIRIGKSNSKTWFMRDIFKDVYQKVMNLYE